MALCGKVFFDIRKLLFKPTDRLSLLLGVVLQLLNIGRARKDAGGFHRTAGNRAARVDDLTVEGNDPDAGTERVRTGERVFEIIEYHGAPEVPTDDLAELLIRANHAVRAVDVSREFRRLPYFVGFRLRTDGRNGKEGCTPGVVLHKVSDHAL